MKDLELDIKGVTARIQMHWDYAPHTCQAVWDMLETPLVDKTHHAVFSGYEFFLYCPAVDLELENHVVYPKPGQLIYYFLPARRNADNLAHILNLGGHFEDAAEVAIWYGEGDLRRVTETGVRGNHFATIAAEDLEAVAKVGYTLLDEGQTTATLRRAEND